MRLNKLTLTSELAHFKNDRNGKNQNTYKSPPLSTIIGILKNIYGEDISDFIFGYTCEYEKKFKDASTIYKEININTVSKSKRFELDICFIEYLVNPKITIYTNIDRQPTIQEILNLGKTNCLAKCKFESDILNKEANMGYNQWTPLNVGNGVIEKINKETKYNPIKGYYDYCTMFARLNKEFEAQYTIESTQEGLQLWKYKGVGDIECYQENI